MSVVTMLFYNSEFCGGNVHFSCLRALEASYIICLNMCRDVRKVIVTAKYRVKHPVRTVGRRAHTLG